MYLLYKDLKANIVKIRNNWKNNKMKINFIVFNLFFEIKKNIILSKMKEITPNFDWNKINKEPKIIRKKYLIKLL